MLITPCLTNFILADMEVVRICNSTQFVLLMQCFAFQSGNNTAAELVQFQTTQTITDLSTTSFNTCTVTNMFVTLKSD